LTKNSHYFSRLQTYLKAKAFRKIMIKQQIKKAVLPDNKVTYAASKASRKLSEFFNIEQEELKS